MIRLLAAALAAWAIAGAAPASAASRIEEIVSPGGIKAWLVRETSVPIVALASSSPLKSVFCFRTGLLTTPTTTFSKTREARVMMSRWPLVTGS